MVEIDDNREEGRPSSSKLRNEVQNWVPKPATYYTNGFQSTQRGVKMCIISVSITQALLVVATDPDGIIY